MSLLTRSRLALCALAVPLALTAVRGGNAAGSGPNELYLGNIGPIASPLAPSAAPSEPRAPAAAALRRDFPDAPSTDRTAGRQLRGYGMRSRTVASAAAKRAGDRPTVGLGQPPAPAPRLPDAPGPEGDLGDRVPPPVVSFGAGDWPRQSGGALGWRWSFRARDDAQSRPGLTLKFDRPSAVERSFRGAGGAPLLRTTVELGADLGETHRHRVGVYWDYTTPGGGLVDQIDEGSDSSGIRYGFQF